jgi:hypothetical protein
MSILRPRGEMEKYHLLSDHALRLWPEFSAMAWYVTHVNARA